MLASPDAWAGLPRPEDLQALRQRLAQGREALKRSATELEKADHALLSSQLTATEDALKRFVELENQQAKKNRLPPLYATVGVLVADDATVVGAADDLLLPFVGLAILVTHFAVMNAPTTAELETAWAEVVSRVQELSRAAEVASSRRKKGCSCVCYGQGTGPDPIGQRPNLRACKEACMRKDLSGYQCGGPVFWN